MRMKLMCAVVGYKGPKNGFISVLDFVTNRFNNNRISNIDSPNKCTREIKEYVFPKTL